MQIEQQSYVIWHWFSQMAIQRWWSVHCCESQNSRVGAGYPSTETIIPEERTCYFLDHVLGGRFRTASRNQIIMVPQTGEIMMNFWTWVHRGSFWFMHARVFKSSRWRKLSKTHPSQFPIECHFLRAEPSHNANVDHRVNICPWARRQGVNQLRTGEIKNWHQAQVSEAAHWETSYRNWTDPFV
jgi:hypothetical protein